MAQKRKAPKTAWKKGQSGNPRGGKPKSDATWGAIFSQLGRLTPMELGKKCAAYAPGFAGLGDKITVQEAVAIRVYAALLSEPSGSLLDKVISRVDGLLPIPMNISWREEAEKHGIPAAGVFEKMVQAAYESLPDAANE
jgi:hypothetical protein